MPAILQGILETLPHVYTEGDTEPKFGVALDKPIAGLTITALVERPDGTGFERVAVGVTTKFAQWTWLATDWQDGCSQLSVKLDDGSGGIETSPPIIVETRAKPDST